MAYTTVLPRLVCISLVMAAFSSAESRSQKKVDTDCGVIAGSRDGTVTSFKGIPYALPPVGKLRWRPPRPLTSPELCRKDLRDKTTNVLHASSFASPCVQYGGPQPNTGAEDCLFLNIWSPMPNTSLLPVAVFFYGGDLTQGKTNWYNMSAFSRAGPVVAVSVSYRLNIFGFLATKELRSADERGVSGNYGFLDQQMALRW